MAACLLSSPGRRLQGVFQPSHALFFPDRPSQNPERSQHGPEFESSAHRGTKTLPVSALPNIDLLSNQYLKYLQVEGTRGKANAAKAETPAGPSSKAEGKRRATELPRPEPAVTCETLFILTPLLVSPTLPSVFQTRRSRSTSIST